MRMIFILTVLQVSILSSNGQELWTGPKITFVKGSNQDWTLAENQDRISDQVWITRAYNKGIFNIKQEAEYDSASGLSPIDTEWAVGQISDGIENLEFKAWVLAGNNFPPQQTGINRVLHLISEDIYIDIKFTNWAQGGGGSGTGSGGAFAYERSTPLSSSDQNNKLSPITIFPNPCNNILYFSDTINNLKIYAIEGQLINILQEVHLENINLSHLDAGIYLLLINDRHIQKLSKF